MIRTASFSPRRSSPHLRCIAPCVPLTDADGGDLFRDGALRLSLILRWLHGLSVTAPTAVFHQMPVDRFEAWKKESRPDTLLARLPLRSRRDLDPGGACFGDAWFDFLDHWEDPGHWRKT